MSEPATVITAAAKAAHAVSRFRPGATAMRHDRLAREEYEDLRSWVTDTANAQWDHVRQLKKALVSKGMLASGDYGWELSRIHETYARLWRDRRRQSERKLAELREAEGASVRLWRWYWRQP